jgi:hypothetical protein
LVIAAATAKRLGCSPDCSRSTRTTVPKQRTESGSDIVISDGSVRVNSMADFGSIAVSQ